MNEADKELVVMSFFKNVHIGKLDRKLIEQIKEELVMFSLLKDVKVTEIDGDAMTIFVDGKRVFTLVTVTLDSGEIQYSLRYLSHLKEIVRTINSQLVLSHIVNYTKHEIMTMKLRGV